MTQQSRRKFIKTTAAASTFMIAGTKVTGPVFGANDRVRICIAGIHGRGRAHMQNFGPMDGVEIAYLADPDSRLFDDRSKMVEDINGHKPKCVQDVRKALEDKDLDVLTIAAPNHWHSLLGIWGCQAGKDVYVEKPCSHNLYEGRKLVEAARRYDRVVQHGTQRRSSNEWDQMVQAAASGKYGKLTVSYGYASKPRGSIGFAEYKEPPKELDFDMWLGPAEKQAYHENLVHYNWHWFWDFGNGEIGNQGVHQMDVARWAVTAATGKVGPESVISMGGRYGYKDQGQTPNTQLTVYDFGDVKMIFEDYGLVNNEQKMVTNEFYTTDGVIKDGKFFAKGKSEGEPIEKFESTLHGGDIFHNFIDCVRNHTPQNLDADVLEGHLSALHCHLGNISYRLGDQAAFSKAPDSFSGDSDSSAAFEKMKEQLSGAIDKDLSGMDYRLGRHLKYDAKNEKIVGDEVADGMLAPPSRPAYRVPETV
ncbi:MAG: Gfo/Idh/MocA family oxidoreductase [Candidatus Omnitrophica bacterium]|nr:Gfo/Idh/MocA family oxidoreductase [Candidatus Omnitrophota bacterium]